MRAVMALLLMVFGLVTGTGAVDARRVALVIGINDYAEVPSLQKAVGDAEAMSATLRELGFEVTQVLNADRRGLNIAISQFTAALGPDDVAFVHFSGHGVEIDGENFLLPADIPTPKSGHEDAVKYEAIGLQRLISQIADSGARTRLFVIDACRNNPFKQAGTRAVGSSRGLAYVAAPAGTFVMYSAGYGQQALDKLNEADAAPTSVYTRVLTQKLRQPGLSVAEIAQDVRGEVQRLAKSVGHNQRPAYYDELSARLVLRVGDGGVVSKPVVSGNQIELAFWDSVKNSTQPEPFELYLKRFPNGGFAPLARLKLEAMKQPAPEVEVAAKPVDREVVVEPDDGPSREVVRGVQEELNRLGCSAGAPDGLWGRKSAAALERFARHGRTRLPVAGPSRQVFDMLKARTGQICPCPDGRTWKNGACVTVARKAPAKPQPQPVTIEPKQPVRPAQRAYANPRIGGVPVDICVSPFKACKGRAATLWCRSKGYGRAVSWGQAVYPKTRHINGGTCVPSGLVLCGGYSNIVCGG